MWKQVYNLWKEPSERLYAALVTYIFNDIVYQLSEVFITLHAGFDIVNSINDSGMISSAELCTNGLKRHLGYLTDNVNSYLTGSGYLA